jgi:hypothetical protein
MICLSDISVLMQRAVAEGITFMVSRSGVPGSYNLYFAKYIDRIGNRQVRLNYHEDTQQVIQYADESHPIIKFDSVDSVLKYVNDEFFKE